MRHLPMTLGAVVLIVSLFAGFGQAGAMPAPSLNDHTSVASLVEKAGHYGRGYGGNGHGYGGYGHGYGGYGHGYGGYGHRYGGYGHGYGSYGHRYGGHGHGGYRHYGYNWRY